MGLEPTPKEKMREAAELVLDCAEDLCLVADVAVGEEDDEAEALGVVREVEGGADALDHLGAAAAVEAVHVAEARRMLSGVAGTGVWPKAEASCEKRMTWKVSSRFMLRRARRIGVLGLLRWGVRSCSRSSRGRRPSRPAGASAVASRAGG